MGLLNFVGDDFACKGMIGWLYVSPCKKLKKENHIVISSNCMVTNFNVLVTSLQIFGTRLREARTHGALR